MKFNLNTAKRCHKKSNVITRQEIEGMRTFINVGCAQCHSCPNPGGMTFQKTGVFHKYTNDEDIGRFKVTNLESDKYVFTIIECSLKRLQAALLAKYHETIMLINSKL